MDNNIINIIVKSLNGPLPFEQEILLDEWINKSNENRRLYIKLEKVNVMLSVRDGYDDKANRDEILRNIKKGVRKNSYLPITKRLIKGVSIAVSIVILFMMYYYGIKETTTQLKNIVAIENNGLDTIIINGNIVAYLEKELVKETLSEQQESNEIKTISIERKKVETDTITNNIVSVPAKKVYTLILADSTIVHLNSKSKIRYPSKFNNKIREVFLEGEAFFEVKNNPDVPFVVRTRDVNSVVYGTKINVNAYPSSEYIVTTLFTGKVKVNGIDLKPGNRAVKKLYSDNIEVSEVDLRSVNSWMRGEFYFNDMSIKDILDILSKWYNINIHYDSPQTEKLLFTLIYSRDKDIHYVLNMLSKTNKVKFKIKGSDIYVESSIK